jgi:Uma2 family endonuclease
VGLPRRRGSLTYAAYLEIEEHAEETHEFHDGEMSAMSGGSPAHAQLIMQCGIVLGRALSGHPCRAQSSAQRVRISAKHACYPDLMVVCPPLERAPDDPHAITNPSVVFEVLSPSTENFDRSGKFELYGTLPSVRHVVFVSQDRWRIEHFRRMDDGTWRYSGHGPGSKLDLDTLGVSLAIDEIYEGIENFGGPSRDAPIVVPPGLG